jgi:Domain of unknown function (DUF5658)
VFSNHQTDFDRGNPSVAAQLLSRKPPNGVAVLFVIRYIASLLLIFMGTLDCLTTVVGTVYFGTQELNPLISSLVTDNPTGFVILKLGVTISVGITFVLVERILLKNADVNDRSFRLAHNTLRAAYVGITGFLIVVVANNIWVLLQAM